MHKSEQSSGLFVSVIIPALNEERYIARCLLALKAIDHPRDGYEIIVLDNGSVDRTVSIARDLGARVEIAPGLTISALRNLGVRCAKGGIVAFVDADCIVDAGWLHAALRHVARKDLGAVGSRYQYPERPHWIEKAWYAQVRDLNFYGPVRWLSGGNIVMRKCRFEEVGGFDERLRTNEDVDLCDRIRKAGYEIFSDPDVRVVHLGNPKTLSGFFRREIWYGKDIFRKFIANFPSMKNLKVVALGAVYGLSMLLLSMWLVAYALGYSSSYFGETLLATMIMLPVGMAIRQMPRNGSWILWPQLSLLYFVYAVARGVVFLNPGSWLQPPERGKT